MKRNFRDLRLWTESRQGRMTINEEKCLIKVEITLGKDELIVKTFKGLDDRVLGRVKGGNSKLAIFPPGVKIDPNRIIAVKIKRELSNCFIVVPLFFQDYFILEEGEYEGFLVRIWWSLPYVF